MTKSNAYQILNLPYGEEKDRIEQAFASMILVYKPDEHPEMFMKIHEAYKTLTTGNEPFDIHLGTFEGKDFSPDEWEDSFNQMDQEHDVQKEKEKAEKEEQKKRAEEAKKERIARKEKRNAIPDKFNWDYALSAVVVLFAFQYYIYELSFLQNILLSALLFYYKAAVYLVRKRFKTEKYITKHLVSLLCVIVCSFFSELIVEPNTPQFDCLMFQWSFWVTFWMITGMIGGLKKLWSKVKI